jgi:WD40 repeat protein/serine/threonine protein kinase
MSIAPADALVARLPLPLAQLYRRAHNAKTARDRRDFAYYQWEAALKLLASAALAAYAEDPCDGDVNRRLPDLAAPSLGQWCDLVVLLPPVLARRGDAGFAAVHALLVDRRDDLPRCVHLSAVMLRALDRPGAGRTTVCPKELLRALVEYRNKEFGHGAPAARDNSAVAEQADALAAAAVELFDRLDVLAGRRLMAVTDVRVAGGVGRAARVDLTGLNPWQTDPLEWPLAGAAGRPPDVGVYLADPARPGQPAGLRPLHPLAAYDSAAETVLLYNGRAGRTQAAHLCYVTNRMPKLNLAGTVHSPLLARLLGVAVAEGEPAAPTEPAAAPADEAAAPRVLGDYELRRELGRGAAGVVWEAWQPVLRRRVALKVQPRTHDPAADRRFLREIAALGRVEHPHLIKVFTSGSDGGSLYYTMELIDGAPLSAVSAVLLRGGAATTVIDLPRWQAAVHTASQAPPPADAPPTPPAMPTDREYVRRMVELVRQAAEAVAALHEAGVLHRDVKPGNVMVTAGGTRAVLTDLGTARLTAEPSTLTKQFLGTLRYASLEQLRGEQLDARADVYSLGATLWELLALRPIFAASDQTPTPDLIRRLEADEPARLGRVNRAVGDDLEAVVHRCLEKRAAARYATARELAADLRRVLDGEPVAARPVTRVGRASRWVRRRPALAALAALLVLVFLAGFVGVSWQYLRAEGAYRELVEAAPAKRHTAYARDVARAYAEWYAGNAGLAEQVHGECEPDLRGWEWHYLRRLFRVRQLATLDGHPGGVRAVAFSPDGARVASAGADGLVKVWDRRPSREVRTLRGHGGAVAAVAFSPDGHRLASGDAGGTIRVWDIAGGGEVVRWRGHTAGVTGLAFDPGGRRLASTGGGESSRGELRLWVAATGEALAGETWPRSLLAAVAFSPDGRRLATASHDGSVAVWDAATLNALGTREGQINRHIRWTSVAFSADGARVAAGGRVVGYRPVGLVRVWDEAAAQEFLTQSAADVFGVAFSGHDGRIVVASTADSTVQGWYTRSGLPAFTLRGHRAAVTAVACGPDGECLASGCLDGAVKLWDISRRDDDLTLRPQNQGLTGAAFSPDGGRLAWASRDRAVQVRDLATGEEEFTLQSLPAPMNGLAFSPDGARLASAGADGAIRVWDVPARRELLCLRGHDGPAHAVAFRPDGAELASAGADGTVRVWGAQSGRERLRLGGHGGAAHAVAFSPDGRRLASAGEDDLARVWETDTGREVLGFGGHSGPVYAAAFSPDGQYLATGGRDEAVLVWDAATGELARALRGHAGAVRCLAYGPGGRLASAGDDAVVRLWDDAGRGLLALRGPTGAVRALAFSPDGHRLASASDDRTIKVWDGAPTE